MVGKTARIRKDDRVRFETIKLHCGCLPCMLLGHLDRHTSIEHVTDAGRRVGEGSAQHEATIGLCEWHHFGVCMPGKQRQYMIGEFGPSLAHGRKPFEEHFGDEVHILIPTQNFLLDEFERKPWPEYNVSLKAARLTRHQWISLIHAYQNT